MENRSPATGEAAAAGRTHRLRWLLLAGAVLVILLVLVSAARLFAPGSADPWRDRGGQTVGQSAPAAQEAPDETTSRPALIIDAPVDRPDAMAQDNPLARIQPQPAAAAADDARGTGDARESGPAPVAAANPARPAAAPRARSTARSGNAGDGGGLLSTLLGIIHQQDGSAPGGHDSMDSLVAHVLAENERTQTETSAALASLGQPQAAQADTPSPPTRAQRELQSCPAANTVQGINCRDRICARWAGRDPACPAR